MRFVPREEKFYVLFLSQVAVISEGSRLLLEGVRSGNSLLAKNAEKILDLEHKGDEIIHDVVKRLNQTFITPLDPEDIHSLASSLDDVIDGIEDAAHRMVAYQVEPIPDTVVTLAEIVHSCCMALKKAVEGLEKNQREMQQCIIEINKLENDADRVVRGAVIDLFQNEKDPIRLIKLKEIYEFLEATTDHCEDVADVLQNVVVKNS